MVRLRKATNPEEQNTLKSVQSDVESLQKKLKDWSTNASIIQKKAGTYEKAGEKKKETMGKELQSVLKDCETGIAQWKETAGILREMKMKV
eukprot:5002212-Amphidinium_carterae.1